MVNIFSRISEREEICRFKKQEIIVQRISENFFKFYSNTTRKKLFKYSNPSRSSVKNRWRKKSIKERVRALRSDQMLQKKGFLKI